MATVAELLKAAGIADDVAAGLPKEVVTALTGYVSEADTKLQTAAQEATKAEEARRQAELERKEINDYVENYGTSLTKMASVEAHNKALTTYLESLKTQGFNVTIPGVTGTDAKPIVPGSPAVGGNALDEGKILGRVGDVLSQYLDSNNEHIRLYGTPIPDDSTMLAQEAARARKSIREFAAEKYGYAAKRKEQADAAFKTRVDNEVKQKLEEEHRKAAEEGGSNPNLRTGESSRHSFVPKIKRDEFQKSSGNVPSRERRERMLDKIHGEVAAAQGA